MNLLIALLITTITNTTLSVKSTEFANTHSIPFKFTCDGLNINPAFVIENIPEKTKSLAFIMDDTESPNGEFVHWIMWNIPINGKISENSAPGIQGKNSMKQNKYFGPCPPNGLHTYNFKVYALDIKLSISDTTGKLGLQNAMEGHILSAGQLTGKYKRQ